MITARLFVFLLVFQRLDLKAFLDANLAVCWRVVNVFFYTGVVDDFKSAC